MATINLIDPTQSNLTGNTDYQNLFIYVDMTAERKGFTSIELSENTINTSNIKTVNLLGLNNNKFTTDYTKIYNDNNIYEGFGIKSISIETNASYVPKIMVDFVDIKGMSFFNNPNDSPYSVLFDFPPPIFNLKVKGYYGKTLEYKLHMLRHNTRFNADDGNYYITAEFVGNTFAPLTDILFQNVLMVSKLEDNPVNVDSKKEVDSLAGLVAISKTIKNDIINNLENSDDYKRLIELNNSKESKNNGFETLIELGENDAIVKIYKNRLSDIIFIKKYDLIQEFTLRNLNIEDNIEYYIVSYKEDSIKEIFERIFNAFLNNSISNIENGNTLNISHENNQYSINIKIKENLNNPIFYVKITTNIISAIDSLNINNNEFDESYQNIESKAKNLIVDKLGFEPTIYNVMEIIARDIDKWIDTLVGVYNDSSGQINNNPNLKRLYPDNIKKIYPFPDFIENNKKTLPRKNSDLGSMPEVVFTDKFIDKFRNYKEEIKLEEAKKTQSLVDEETGKNVWFPINPLDSSILSDAINPYVGLTTPNQIFSTMFARLYIYYFFTLNNEKNNGDFKIDINNEFVRYFFENEKNTILNTIKDKKLISSFKGEIEKIDTADIDKFIPTISRYVDYELINKYKNKILTSFGLSNSESFKNTIQFKNFDSIPRTDDTGFFINLFNNIFTSFPYLTGYKTYKVKDIKSNEIGLALNIDNNIMFNDGSNDITEFVAALDNDEKFNGVILNSIKSGLLGVTGGVNIRYIRKNKLIKNTLNINEVIYDYYINNGETNEKKLYGLLHIIYVPDLKIIEQIILNKPLIINLPILTKLYLGALAYAYDTRNENNYVYEVNPFYLDEKDKNLLDINNRDFIYNLWVDEFSDTIRDNFVNYRKNIFEKLSIHKPNLDIYKNYFINNSNNTNINNILNFVNSLLVDSGKFNMKKISFEGDTIDYTNISFLSEKTSIINSTTLNYKTFNPFGNNFFGDENKLKKDLTNLFTKEIFVRAYFDVLKKELIKEIPDKVTKLEDNEKTSNSSNFQDVRIETYYSFKNFVDRWLVTNESSTVSRDVVFSLEGKETPFINLFQFIDRASNPTVAETAIVDISILQEFENDYSVNMLTVIGKLLNENGFEFYPLQNFIDFENEWTSDQIFTPQITEIDKALRAPKFTCMYVGSSSKYLNSDYNKNTSFKNDGILNISDAVDFSDEGGKAFGFRVRFGDGKQSIFSKIEVSTDEVQPTNESLKALSLIVDNGGKSVIPTAQNLFSTYEQRSYMCKITMFGDAMIQPTQYFMLENIPMFAGLYLILKVNHSIDGETNSMMTTFEGIRLPKEPKPFITNVFDVYIKSYLSSTLSEPSTRNNNGPETSRNLEKKNRTIYLVAGHDFVNDPGAVFKVPNSGTDTINERDLTKELRDLIKTELDLKNVKNEIDNDNSTRTQVINLIESKINSDDLVFDIHFNSFGNQSDEQQASGIEVFIKDSLDQNTIDLAKEVANVIQQTLELNLRKSTENLPSGVKIQSTTQYRTLEIFSIKATVILIEVCFMSNSTDHKIYQSKKIELSKNLAQLFSELSVGENDKKLQSVQTYTILNTLRYDNLNRTSPYLIPSEKIDTFNSFINNLKFTKIFEKEEYTANNLKQVYNNNLNLYRANIRSQIELTANKYRIDALLLAGIIYIESKFQPLSVSKGSAIGLGQFTFNGAMPEVLGYMNGNRTTTTNIYKFSTSTNSFILTSTTYGDILNILFDNEPISKLIFSFDKFRTTLEGEDLKETLVKNVFNNPFIMIEMVGIYIERLERYSNTSKNKNAGILSLNYNVGNHGLTNYTGDKPYFDHIIDFYNKTKFEEIKNKLVGKIPNEGIKYPERLIDEYLSKFISIDEGESNLFT